MEVAVHIWESFAVASGRLGNFFFKLWGGCLDSWASKLSCYQEGDFGLSHHRPTWQALNLWWMEVTICHVLVALHTACAVALYRLFPALYYHFFFLHASVSVIELCVLLRIWFFFFFLGLLLWRRVGFCWCASSVLLRQRDVIEVLATDLRMQAGHTCPAQRAQANGQVCLAVCQSGRRARTVERIFNTSEKKT